MRLACGKVRAVADLAKPRVVFLDWIRGFACVLMFQTHGYDSWLSESARHTALYRLSQLGGTLPAPLFLFASGISLALVMGRALQKGITPGEASRKAVLRGAEILGFGMLFRLQEFVLGQPYAPWTDLLRVDILNIIGVAIILMGLVCWLGAPRIRDPRELARAADARDAVPRSRYVILAIAIAGLIALSTPPIWTTHRPRWLPWYLESYINGVHNLRVPQPWLFPAFPWGAFAFAGLAFGFLVFSPWARTHETHAFVLTGLAGALFTVIGRWLDASPRQLYAVSDFWHTSPNFFLIRTGILFSIVFLAYAWCRWGAALQGFAPVIEIGRTSLFVYWVHIEFVYGRFSILAKRSQSILAATVGIFVIFAAMVVVAAIRNQAKGGGLDTLGFWRRPARAVTEFGKASARRLGLLRSAVGFLRLLGKLENHFAGTSQPHLLARDAFNGLGVGAQRLDLFAEIAIFLIEPVDLAAQFVNLRLRATHGQQAVASENVVDGQKQQREAKNGTGMAAPKGFGLLRFRLSHSLTSRCGGKNPRARGFCKAPGFFRRRAFRIDAHQGLGPGQTQQDPRTVIEEEFQAIGAVGLRHALSQKFREITPQPLHGMCFHVLRQVQVRAHRPILAADATEKGA